MYLEFLEHWADVLDAYVKTRNGQSADSIGAETCINHTLNGLLAPF